MVYRSVCVCIYIYRERDICVCVYLQTTYTQVLEKEERSKYESTSGRREDVSLRYLEDKDSLDCALTKSLKPPLLL